MMNRISVLGAGGFGIALAKMTNENGNDVTLWSAFEQEINHLKEKSENEKLLPGVILPTSVKLTTDLNKVKGSDVLILAVPSQAVRSVSGTLKKYLCGNEIIVNVAKGLEHSSLMTLSQVLTDVLENQDHVALSGPSHAEEVARGIPTTVVVASKNMENAEKIQDLLANPNFRIYSNDDVTGVEIGGSLKNVIALASGICDGLGLGDNTKAALMTRGISEIARLGRSLGARIETFAGLSGIGDLIVTCTSMHSRNRRAGILIGQGMKAKEAIQKIGMTVEGYITAHSAYQLAIRQKIEMPIIEQVYNVMYNDIPANEAITALMGRPQRHESERFWIGS